MGTRRRNGIGTRRKNGMGYKQTELLLSYPLLTDSRNALSSGACPFLNGPSSTEKPSFQNRNMCKTFSLLGTGAPDILALGPSVSPRRNPNNKNSK